MATLEPQFALHDFRQVQLAALRLHGTYYCSVCEDPVSYQARHWDFCTACGELCHSRCLSSGAERRCFRCKPH